MLARFEIQHGRAAPAAQLDIVALVRPLRDVFERTVGQGQQQVVQLLVKFLGLGLHRCDLGLLVCDNRAQTLELRFIAAGLGCAHLFRGAILFGLCGLRRRDPCAACLVQCQHR